MSNDRFMRQILLQCQAVVVNSSLQFQEEFILLVEIVKWNIIGRESWRVAKIRWIFLNLKKFRFGDHPEEPFERVLLSSCMRVQYSSS